MIPWDPPNKAVCPMCDGTTWRAVPPNKYGYTGVERCSCFTSVREQCILAAANIPLAFEAKTIEDMDLSKNETLRRAALDLKGYIREFPNVRPPGLLLCGPPACGKSHMACAVLKALIAKGHEGRFIDFANLIERIKFSYGEDNDRFGNPVFYWDALDVEILLIDDLGAIRASDFVEDTLLQILASRCNANRPTIITTNLYDDAFGIAAVERYRDVKGVKVNLPTIGESVGMRSRSRLFEMCRIVAIEAEDYRRRNAVLGGSLRS